MNVAAASDNEKRELNCDVDEGPRFVEMLGPDIDVIEVAILVGVIL